VEVGEFPQISRFESSTGTFGRLATTLSVQVGATKNFEGGETHQVMTIKNHPYFNRITYDYDVALLKLKTRITIDDLTKQEITMANYGEALPEQTPVRKLLDF
jgi:hypothetical protein